MPPLDHVVLQVPGGVEGSVTDITGELLLPPVIVLLPQGDHHQGWQLQGAGTDTAGTGTAGAGGGGGAGPWAGDPFLV